MFPSLSLSSEYFLSKNFVNFLETPLDHHHMIIGSLYC